MKCSSPSPSSWHNVCLDVIFFKCLNCKMVSTVSTRGVKFKFSEGEKVLCYEPDPTKAKVLYDSKVLELHVSRDNRGRKVPEYLIHFFGWSSSWDRCVKEEFILPDTEENRILQTKLAQEAASSLKGKRKGKLPPIIKETLYKKESTEETKEPKAEVKKEVSESSGSEFSDEECDKIVQIEIPQRLKEKLEEDWCFITKKDKVIRLPCEHSVISILEDYVKHLATELLAPQNKNLKFGKDISTHVAEAKIHFCKEVMDGIRVYFDFTLPHLLLYRQEKKQFYTVGNTCVPVSKYKSEPNKKVQKPSETSAAAGLSPPLKEQTKISQSNPSHQHSSSVQSITRGGLRNQATSQKSPPQKEEEVNGSTRVKGIRNQSKESTLTGKKQRAVGSREGLRSRAKTKSVDETTSTATSGSANTTAANASETESSSGRPESPSTPTSPSRQTRATRSTQNAVQAQMMPNPTVQLSRSPAPQKKTSTTITSVPPGVPVSNLLTSLTVCVSNINPTTAMAHSTAQSQKIEKPPAQQPSSPPPPPPPASQQGLQHQQPQGGNAGLLKEVLSWRMLPQYLYEQIPAAPSLIYGVQHLLRLFVKLPELIYKTNMPQKKLGPLLDTIEDFLQYLSERREELFLTSAYVDSYEDSTDGNVTVSA